MNLVTNAVTEHWKLASGVFVAGVILARIVFQYHRKFGRRCPECLGTKIRRWNDRSLFNDSRASKGEYVIDCSKVQRCLNPKCRLSREDFVVLGYHKHIEVGSWYPNHWLRHLKYGYLLKEAPGSGEVAVRTL